MAQRMARHLGHDAGQANFAKSLSRHPDSFFLRLIGRRFGEPRGPDNQLQMKMREGVADLTRQGRPGRRRGCRREIPPRIGTVPIHRPIDPGAARHLHHAAQEAARGAPAQQHGAIAEGLPEGRAAPGRARFLGRPAGQIGGVLADVDLVSVAKTKGQGHRLAIAGRSHIRPIVTDALVDSGDRAVVRKVTANAGAEFSENSFVKLVNESRKDQDLAGLMARRADVPEELRPFIKLALA